MNYAVMITIVLSKVFITLLGAYLITNSHPVAGGWTLAAGVLAIAFTEFSSRSGKDKDEDASSGPAKTPAYEYIRINMDPAYDGQGAGIDGKLNELAASGWRLVTQIPTLHNHGVLLLERPASSTAVGQGVGNE